MAKLKITIAIDEEPENVYAEFTFDVDNATYDLPSETWKIRGTDQDGDTGRLGEIIFDACHWAKNRKI